MSKVNQIGQEGQNDAPQMTKEEVAQVFRAFPIAMRQYCEFKFGNATNPALLAKCQAQGWREACSCMATAVRAREGFDDFLGWLRTHYEDMASDVERCEPSAFSRNVDELTLPELVAELERQNHYPEAMVDRMKLLHSYFAVFADKAHEHFHQIGNALFDHPPAAPADGEGEPQ